LLAAVRSLKPTVLIGVSGVTGSFTEKVLKLMAGFHDRPVIFALSNPTSKAECTAEQAYQWTGGRAIFASGSPFPPVKLDDQSFVPGQGNNAYIFPGVGLGVVASEARRVTDAMFIKAASTLASLVRDAELAEGRVYPALTRIQEVSMAIAVEVATEAYAQKLTRQARPKDLAAHIRAQMFRPEYPVYA
jgi:malate dehydrogenase (oxaloacetate-decarboxylating)(NADP+)